MNKTINQHKDEDNNKQMYFICPNCYKIPSIEIFQIEPLILAINCKFCDNEQRILYDKYVQIINDLNNRACKFHPNNSNTLFCIDCKIYLCEKCANLHKKSSTNAFFVDNLFDYNFYCYKHNKKEFEYYCFGCREHLCINCLVEHKNHSYCNIADYNNENISQAQENITIAEKELNDYNEKDAISKIKDINDKIEKIEKSYKQCIDNNNDIFDFGEKLADEYEKGSQNFFTMFNLLNNTKYKIDEFKGNSPDELIEYFNNLCVIDESQIVDPFRNLFTGVNIDITNMKANTLIEEDHSITSIALLNDGRIAYSTGNIIKIYNYEYNNLDFSFDSHQDTITSLIVINNGNLVSSSIDNSIKIWLINNTFKCEATLIDHGACVIQVIELSRDRFASCSEDKTVKIWNSISPNKCIYTIKAHNDTVISILQIKEKEILISVSNDGVLKFWSLDNYQLLNELSYIFPKGINSLIQLNENTIAVSNENALQIIDISNYKEIHNITYTKEQGSFNTFIELRNGNFLCASSNGNIYSLNPNNIEINLIKSQAHSSSITIFTKLDEHIFSSYGNDNILLIWT